MAAEVFSSNLATFSGNLENPSLQGTLNFLKNVLLDDFKLLVWSDWHVAVPIAVDVELPSLGNFDGLDIRPKEPVLLVFDKQDYPTKAPAVYSDRLDFPKDRLAHLYIAKNGRPPAFCYVRENSDDWYANKRINDLLIRISNWLRDAVTGNLTEDGSQFEPLRLEGYSGTNTYDYDMLSNIVHKKASFVSGHNWTIGLFDQAKDQVSGSFQLVEIVTPGNMDKVMEAYRKEKEKQKDDKDKRFYRYGFILWADDDQTYEKYNIDLPTNWETFKKYCETFKIPYNDLEGIISDGDTNHYAYFPVILAIRRPKNLIGFSSNIEFVNLKFCLYTDDVSEGKLINNIPISFQAHNQPLTPEKAQHISGYSSFVDGKGVVFGCGALGSKVTLHLARSGQTNFTLIDPDHLSPHNLVRHSSGGEYVGSNKAFALAEVIRKLYPTEELPLLSVPSYKEGRFEKKETFDKCRWIFDFTASDAFFNRLVLAESFKKARIFSASISDFGNLGILLKEGKSRNPRIDDLQVYLYSCSMSDEKISSWLKREREAKANNNLVVRVGVGCNSETTILSDEKISAHGAFVAAVLKREMADSIDSQAKIKLHRITEDSDYQVETDSIDVKPFDVLTAVNDSSWTIRFKDGLLDKIKKTAAKKRNRETGGSFLGAVNYKTKVIHVTDLIDAPPDSEGNQICFYRGHSGLSQKISMVIEKSGGQIGYVGEWHSHPQGPNCLSDVDMASVNRFKKELSELVTPLPVFLTVVAPVGILPYIF
ncbi:ThiF family adenylyltransferase [Parapedobacter soli]|uniref:ThiF family adenylyltransferase n=1 Tax=Parapedobacter soli TaxID=416955 RepID=UPI0021C95771|nr:ThiF family adenylyltransferase [Parapedobacter soli]